MKYYLAMTVSLNLSPQLEEMIQRKMASGRYRNRDEAQDPSHALQSEYLRRDIVAGLESGPATPFDLHEIKQAARQHHAKRKITK